VCSVYNACENAMQACGRMFSHGIEAFRIVCLLVFVCVHLLYMGVCACERDNDTW
jgi:hypothetical protein